MGSQASIDGKFPSHVLSTDQSSLSLSYEPPKIGWMSQIPPSWLPLIELMRLDRPNGFWYFYLSHLYGTLYAATYLESSVTSLFQTNLILLLDTIVIYDTTYTWNDTLDAPFNRLVPQTRNRPVTRDAISPFSTHLFIIL